MRDWAGREGAVARAVLEQNARLLDTYRADPRRAEQDANIERSITEGAYARRQLFELIQNAADAMRDTRGRCQVLLTETHMFVANTGQPLTPLGVQTLMAAHLSTKRDDQIGRFGLGFKSVLAVSDSPMIISRSGSIVFDRAWSRQQIANAVPDAEHFPVTRMARPEDPARLAGEVPELEQLMRWAETVVVLPLRSTSEVLTTSIRTFPAEFLLFSAQVRQLGLIDRTRTTDGERRIVLQRDGEELLLQDGNRRSRWVVSGAKHSPSKGALADGGYQAARDLVTLNWAAPIEGGGRGVGRFWAFFPTSDDTTLSGIVNAPWKLADDRESLLPGQFNDELLTEVLPDLVAKALPRLHSAEQPATVIDVLPARGKESRSHADDVINLPVMEAVAEARCIPTLDGGLSRPKGLRMHPEGLLPEELELWATACSDPGRWVSHAINSSERRSKVNRLGTIASAASSLRTVDLVDWIEHLVDKPTVMNSAIAVRLVAQLITRRPELRNGLTRARVMLLDDGSLHSCQRGSVFLPGGSEGAGHLFIDSALASDPAVTEALEVLGIKILDDVGALRSELTAHRISWQNVWISSRKLPVEEAEEVFREVLGDKILETIEVQAADGKWKLPNRVFLPGPIVPTDMSRDPASAVHPVFHKQDMVLLHKLGLVDAPTLRLEPPMESWRRVAYSQLRDMYREKERKQRLPDSSIDIMTGRIAWPLDPLHALSPEGRTALTTHLLSQLDPAGVWRISLKAGGTSRQTGDLTWLHLQRHGCLRTNAGVQPVSRCLAFEHDGDYAVIDGIDQPLPVVSPDVTQAESEALGLRTSPGDLTSEDWKRLVEQAAEWPMGRRSLLYAWAALCGAERPTHIRAAYGATERDFAPDEVAVAVNTEMFESLTQTACPALRVERSDDAQHLMESWGLADGADMLNESVDYDPAGELELLVDRYPPLRLDLDMASQRIQVQPCSRLALLVSTPTGEQSRPLSCKLQDGILLTTAVDDATILTQVGEVLNSPLDPEVVLQRMADQRRNALRAEITACDRIERKLVLAIGVDQLRASVPGAALEGSGPDLSDVDIARLALAVHGYSILSDHAKALESKRLDPPTTWAGTRGARDWVRRLGFPAEFAGFASASLDPELEVQGPPVLGELHDYQQEIADRIRELLDPQSEKRRGLVPLPTGAGKTRVAVQALTDYLSGCHEDVDIVWVAETEELCEQAVRTWSEVWRAKGAPGVPLTISRLWGNNNPIDHTGLQVVVATISKLQTIVDRPQGWTDEYGWLGSAALIVVDEAHRSIAPQYTRVLSALGGTNRVTEMTMPLLGLTATPFRGYNHEETRRLTERYHGNRLDIGVFPDGDAYGFLQQRGVLARVTHSRLAGSEVTLTDAELNHVTQMQNMPDSVGRRLGEDTDRNAAIVDSICGLPTDASVLLFATSVENARVLAALLTFHGIEARAIAGQTAPAARRRYIEDFREGRIRVLTNYSVFAEGFDAPKVDAVYVTRPTFSPNVYQQMIGRGLRGPLNGGKEEVLVVNVDDNITNYGEKYAFTHFEHLWNRN